MLETQKQFRFIVDGHSHNVLLDRVTLSLIPLEHKVKGDFHAYVRRAILALWIEMYSRPDHPELTRGDMVLKMASDTNATNSAVVRCACSFYAGQKSIGD